MTTIDEQINTALDTTAASFRRRMAVADLARSDDPRAWETLTRVLDDEDRYLRREVVSSLCRLSDERVVAPLMKALDDSDDYVRRDAVEGLAKNADARAIEPLRALAEDAPYSVREAARRALDEFQRLGISPPTADETAASADHTELSAEPPHPSAAVVPQPSEPEAAISAAEDEETVSPATITESLAPEEPERQAEKPAAEPEEPAFPHIEPAEAEPERTEPVLQAEPKPAEIAALIAEPAAKIADASAAPGIQFVTAEIIAESAEPAEALPPVSSSECFLVALPERFDWQRAARMRALLAEALADIAPLYEELAGQQHQLLALDEEHRQAFMELGLQRADKEDDLSRCEDSLQAARDELARLERAATRADRERTVFEAQAKSMWNQFLGALHSERNEKNRQTIAEMEENLRELRTQIATVRERVRDFQRQHDELSEPVKQAQTHYESLTSRRDAVADQIREINERIDGWLLDFLHGLAPDERQSRLQQCARLSSDPDFFDLCSGPLMRALSELRGIRSELQTTRQQQREATSAAQRSLESLGETIAAGFHVGQSPRRTIIRLTGSLRVNEQHGLFEGYSGADGWASGSGKGEAEYQLEEIIWTPPADLSDAVQQFAGTWVLSGQHAARHERLAAVVEACERTAAEFVRFLRGELERDFQEARP